jgi:hypothetical protein
VRTHRLRWHAALRHHPRAIADVVTYTEETSSETGPAIVPAADARQVMVSLNYVDTKAIWAVVLNQRPQWPPHPGDLGWLCTTRFTIQEAGLYNPGGTWQYIKSGPSILAKDDGVGPFSAHYMTNLANSDPYAAHYHLCVLLGHGVTYGAAATVGAVTIRAETGHSSATNQCGYWGSKTRTDQLNYGRTDGLHRAWGNNAKAGSNPGVFYNY